MSELEKVPRHVAIIMDGNGRWASKRGEERSYGHSIGAQGVRTILQTAARLGVQYLTVYVFSTENWGRPHNEVDTIMELLCQNVVNETPELQRQGARVAVIGDRRGISDKVNRHLDHSICETEGGQKITLILALNYSSRSELTCAVRNIARQAADGTISAEEITEKTITQNLYTAPYPDPDLVIRTGGEVRLSNFLLWQSAYAELYFTDTLWPDFGAEDLEKAIAEYARRERRFGRINTTK